MEEIIRVELSGKTMLEKAFMLLQFAKWLSVVSSNVKDLWYDEAKQLMKVRFKSGGSYSYQNVPLYIYERIRDAESIGSEFYWLVREHPERYPYSRNTKGYVF